jgi:hypothetical protein
MDIVADEAYRTGGEDGDGLGFEVVVGFLDGLLEFFSPPKIMSWSCISVEKQ